MIKLSKRLQAVADFVEQGAIVADIGSDHALLPVYLVQSGKCNQAIAGELNKGPFHAARKQAAAAMLEHKINVRQGNGLAILKAEEADTITIAGMGGGLIRDILEEGRKEGKLQQVKTLILQPNIGEELVRYWLSENGWFLIDELILEEDGKIYEIIKATSYLHPADSNLPFAAFQEKLYDGSFLGLRRNEQTIKRWLYKMGPYLLRSPKTVFVQKWYGELDKLDHICKQMNDSDNMDASKKLKQFEEDIAVIREVLQCISTDKH